MKKFAFIISLFLISFINQNLVLGQSISISGSITEGAEDGDSIEVTLTQSANHEKFRTPTNITGWSIQSLPSGVSIDNIVIKDSIHAVIYLKDNRDTDYESDINARLVITNIAIASDSLILNYTKNATLTSGYDANFNALIESATISGSINEGNEDAGSILVNLTNDTFTGSTIGWIVNDLPSGVSVQSISTTSTTATIHFQDNRDTDYDSDIDISVEIPSSAIHSNSSITTNPVSIFQAITESATITGTIKDASKNKESDIIAGNVSSIIITLSGEKWKSTVGDDNPLTVELINAITGNGDWGKVTEQLTHSHIIQNNETTITILLPSIPLYSISANETVTISIPGNTLQSNISSIPNPASLTIVQENIPIITISGTIKDLSRNKESDIKNGTGSTIILTISGDEWDPSWSAATQLDVLNGITGDKDWADVRAALDDGDIEKNTTTKVTIGPLPAISNYLILSDETLSITIPASAIKNWTKAIVVTEKLTIKSETSLPTGNIVGSGERCAGSSTKIPLYISLTGNAPWNIKYKINGGSETSISVPSSPYTLLATTAGNYTLSEITDNSGLTVTAPNTRLTGTGTVIVNALPIVSITQPLGNQNYSSSQDSIQLKGNPLGGVFSGPGVTSNDSMFHPKLLIAGTYSVKYTYSNANGCTNSATSDYTVITGNESIIFPGNITQYCNKSAPIIISGQNNQAAVGFFGFSTDDILWTFAAPGLAIEPAGDNLAKIFPERMLPTKYKIRYFNLFPAFDVKADFEIKENPTGITIDYTSGICVNADTSIFEGIGLSPGGTGFFSYNGPLGGIINYSTTYKAKFIPAIAKANTYEISFYYITSDGCYSDTVKKPIIVHPKPVVDFTMLPYYNYELPIGTIVGSPMDNNGVFSPTAILDNNGDGTADIKAGLPVSEYSITYSYIDGNGCSGDTTKKMNVLKPSGDILGINSHYCYWGSIPDTLSGVITETKGNPVSVGFEVNGVPLQNLISDSIVIISPDSLLAGIDTLDFIYRIGSIPFKVRKLIDIDSIGNFDFGTSIEDKEYCNSDLKINLAPQQPSEGGVGTFLFSGTGISGEFFDPTLAVIGKNMIYCQFIRNLSGCKKTLKDSVYIKKLPYPNFIINDPCITGRVSDSSQFINTTFEQDSVIKWSWDFGDVGSGFDNFDTIHASPKHYYRSPGRTFVKVHAIHQNGCSNDTTIQYSLGQKPIADFYWVNDCFTGDSIEFINTTSASALSNADYLWVFFMASKNDSVSHLQKKDLKYLFPNQNDYRVDLFVTTDEGCLDTMSKFVHLRPTINIDSDSAYQQSFNKGPGDWFPLSSDTVSSWKYGVINEPKWPGDSAYFTVITTANLKKPENSSITSPCFDLSGLERPMIKMDIMRSFERNRNGAVLQYTVNNGKDWKNIGNDINDGINWYNSFTIMQGTLGPGGQGLGWTNSEGIYAPDTNWVEARQMLDEISNKAGIRFRIAYGSDGTLAELVNGFAFDNIWIGERNKQVLIEHFTNTSGTNENSQDAKLNTIIDGYNSKDLIDVRYHLNYPLSDPFYADQPIAPVARTLYYGISNPIISVLDGLNSFDYATQATEINKASVNKQLLNEPIFDISLSAQSTGSNIVVQTQLKSRKAIMSKEITLHVLAIEKEISSNNNASLKYRNVVKKMLPDPAGTSIVKSWMNNEVASYTVSGELLNIKYANNLQIVAFLQDESTKEILQSAILDSVIGFSKLPSNSISNFLNVFPNPADEIIYVSLPTEEVHSDCYIEFYNIQGILVKNFQLNVTSEIISIDVSNLTAGVYFIKLTDSKGNPFIQKIIVE